MKISTALHTLRTYPSTFLANNLVSIDGKSRSEVIVTKFGYHDVFAQPINEGFKFSPYFISSRKVGIDGMSHKALRVHNVRMNPNTEDLTISAIPGYILGAGGPDIMVTGQLSACVFAVRQEVGRLIVAHIQPGGGRQSGAMLAQTIRMMGHFAPIPNTTFNGGRVTHVFGLGRGYTARAHVLGVRTGGLWRIYAQRIATGNGPIQGPTLQIV